MKHLKVAEIMGRGRKCALSALMLLAILAPSAQAGLLYEPSNYAARGNLLLQLDGIRNTGLLKAHDNAATTWFNLVDPRTSATLNQYKTNTGNSAWRDNAYYLDGDKYWQTIAELGGSSTTTIEVFGDLSLESMEAYANYISRANTADHGIWIKKGENTLWWKANVEGLTLSARPSIPNWDGKGFSAVLDTKQAVLYTGGVAGTPQTRTDSKSLPGCKYNIGCAYSTTYYPTKGTFYSVRIYNRALTAAEVKQNYDLDQIRFVTGMPVTNVVVATAVAGLEGNEGTGVYAYDEEGYTFTAPRKATKDGADYVCTGYTLETWNGTGWSAPVSFNATSYTATDTTAKVRLVWQWQYASGSKSSELDPLFDNYETDGLVLHLDGIRNAGKNSPHDYSAKQWVDLVDGKVATIARDEGDASEWLDDGYYFDARSFAQFSSQLASLGQQVTVQVVCEADTNVLYASKIAQTTRINWPHLVGCNNNDAMNLYYDLNNGTPNHQMTFKCATTDGGNLYLNKGTWEGRYVTVARDGLTKYITQTAALTGAKSNTGKKGDNIPAATVYVGSAGNSVELRSARWFKGTIKSIRIYNRVLSDAELAQNRAIDDARFFGIGAPDANVVVASSVRGVSGDTPDGGYMLPSGGYTFTAPASVTVGEDTYSCAGYTLETWDDETGAWGEAVLHSGETSCALTDMSAKVRLTWKWNHTAGPGYDLAFNDYVTDGLVVHLDGIRNTGAQAVHDSAATTWADLANDGDYAKFIGVDSSCGWTADGYRFDGRTTNPAYAVMNTTRTIGNKFTVQAVVNFSRSTSQCIVTAWPALFGTKAASGDPFAMYYNQNNNDTPGVQFKVANTHTREPSLKGWDGEYMTGWSDGVNAALFQTAAQDGVTRAFNKSIGTQTITFASGNGDGGSSAMGYNLRRFHGTYKSARIYNRALTNAELEQNRAVDEVRFFGRAPAAAGNLVVASTVEGLGGDLPCGAYRPAPGYTFTAQTEAVLDGVPYELAGYTLETWNGSAWADATTVQRGDAPVAVVPDVSTASKRLTWNWVVKSRLTKIKDYDVGDYVQDGLYLNFDGIRNAGATADHDLNATEWVNLGTGGASLNATFDSATGSNSGGWAKDGYNFVNGGKFATLGANPDFDGQCYLTIQVVCDDYNKQTAYPTIFGSTNDYCNIYAGMFTDGRQARFKVHNAGAVYVPNWGEQYVNAIYHAGAYTVFETTSPTLNNWTGKWRGEWTIFKDRPFYIGGVYFPDDATKTNERRFNGKIQAVRVYTRMLLPDELEHNRMVDEARFKGNLPEWNVTIDTKYGHGVGETLTEDVGNYKVEGTYTFSATLVKDSKDVLKDVAGYYTEELDARGNWTNKTWHDGREFIYTEGAKVRVTWGPKRKGMTLVIR